MPLRVRLGAQRSRDGGRAVDAAGDQHRGVRQGVGLVDVDAQLLPGRVRDLLDDRRIVEFNMTRQKL